MTRIMGRQVFGPRWTSFLTIFLLSSMVLLVWSGGTPNQASGQATLTGHENHTISLADATTLTREYRSSALPGSPLAEAFGKDALQELLNQPECIGLKVYFGRRADSVVVLVMVGVNANGTDLVNGKLLETGWPCPPICDVTSPLGQ